ncbi:non-ribosomal peptide synthetase [Rummeliibacillus suwonensis]|uniref:non-ribosomal peptide synthetase n=1 Tax=Rummeliibacillus suwonensis TaxID=1306154 RepID=UPI0011B3DA14|nr:non-ribosomal peptide synthetase [Rummeliibacillus suwonensis]
MKNVDLVKTDLDEKKRKLKELLKDHKNVKRPIPLTDQQKSLWFFYELAENKKLYNIPYSLLIEGSFKEGAFIQSVKEFINKYPITRVHFIEIDSLPYQQLIQNFKFELPIVDLSELNSNELNRKVEEYKNLIKNFVFDLRNGPLFKFILLKLNNDNFQFIFNFHHIISDGVSIKIFLEELQKNYIKNIGELTDENIENKVNQNLVLPQNKLTNEAYDSQITYWKNKLTGVEHVVDLPYDFNRKLSATYEGKNYCIRVPDAIRENINKIAKENKTTVFTLLLSVFGLLLSRYSKQQDILIGTPVSLRNTNELESTFGFYINTAVLKLNVVKDLNFSKFLSNTQAEVLDVLSNKDIPFENVVEELNIKRAANHNPIFQVMFSYERIKNIIRFSNLKLKPEILTNNVAKFDLTLSSYESEEGLFLDFEYNTDLFKIDTIKEYAEHYIRLIKEVIQNSNEKLMEYKYLNQTEEQELLTLGNNGLKETDNLPLLHDFIKKWAQIKPNDIAIWSNGETLTYKDLNERSTHLSKYLLQMGVKPETLVGIYMEKSIETFIAIISIHKAGGAFVPLEPSYPEDRIKYMIEDSELNYIITKSDYKEFLTEFNIHLFSIDSDWQALGNRKYVEPIINEHNLAYITYTSGTTGQPKGVMIEHRSLSSMTKSYIQDYKLYEFKINLLQLANQSFDVFIGDLAKVAITGGTLFICPDEIKIDFPNLFDFINEHKISFFESTPALVLPFLDYVSESGMNFNSLKRILVGADVLKLKDYKRLLENFEKQVDIINTYGVTETTIDSTLFKMTSSVINELNLVNTPIGVPLSYTKVYILDDNLHLQPKNLPGELYIGGPSVGRGYINNESLTNERFIQSPFNENEKLYKTGDLVKWNKKGFIEIIGRNDHQVKVNGYRVEIGEIEETIKKVPNIVDAAVIIKENSKIDAFFVGKGEVDTITIKKQLKNQLRKNLPHFMIPNTFNRIEALPLTPNGKLDRKELESRSVIVESILDNQKKNRYEILTESLPRTQLEYEIQKIWLDILNLKTITLRESFFEIGGNSIMLVQLLSKIRKKYQVEIPLNVFYEEPSIQHLADIIKNGTQMKKDSFITCVQKEGQGRPVYVFHQTGGNWFRYLELTKHLGYDNPIYALGISNPYGDSDNLKEIATIYIKEIKKVQPVGPYQFIGHSFGGNIAFEMALQLQANNEEVSMLVLLDSLLPQFRTHLDDFELILDYMERYKLNSKEIEQFRDSTEKERLELMLRLGIEKGYLPPGMELEDMEKTLSVNIKLHRAMYTYPKPTTPFRGEIVFFRAIKEEMDSLKGWHEFIEGNITLYDINSTHGVMLTEPYVIEIAKEIKKAINILTI